MEKKIMRFCVCLMSFVVLVIAAAAAKISMEANAMSCEQAIITLRPCEPFLTDLAAAPILPCCIAVTNVNAAANTTEERRALCECFEKTAPTLKVDPQKAKQLPDLCGVKVPVPMDPTIKCGSIQ